MRKFCLLFLLFAAAPAEANPPELALSQTLIVTKTGYYLLTQDDAGVPTLTKIAQVIVLGDAPPPVNPTDPTEAQFRATVRSALSKVTDPNKPNIQKALAQLYSTVAGLPVTDRAQLVTSTDLLFNALGLTPPWAAWKTEVDKGLAGFVALADAKKAWGWVAEELK